MISNIKGALHRVNPLVAAATLILAAMVPVLSVQQASALALTNRSLMVSSTVPSDDLLAPDGSTYTLGAGPGQVPAGDPRNGAKVDHVYKFTPTQATDFESMSIEYCETAFGYLTGSPACSTTADEGLVDSGFSAAAWDGGSVTVWSDTNGDGDSAGDTNEIETWTVDVPGAANYLTIASDGSTDIDFDPSDPVTVTFTATENDYFSNPGSSTGNDYYETNPSGTYFAHITSYAAVNFTSPLDEGTVTNSITQAISIYTRVQETLNFSVEGEGGDLDLDGIPTDAGATCAPLIAPSLIRMGNLDSVLSASQDYFATSYFRLSTNSANGTKVYYSGDTLKSSSHDLTALTDAAPVASTPGDEQFGLALNLAASTLADLDETTDAYEGGEDDEFAFNTGSVATPIELANSDGVVACDTGHVRYVANIDPDTPAGIYTTKINYIASPSY